MAGIYVHIPFCKSRCAYCDFYSTTLGNVAMGRYVDAILTEAQLRADEIEQPVETVYFGGGTPSMLPPESLERLVAGLHLWDLNCREMTIEVNPDDVTAGRAAAWREMGFNRVSMGVQSFVDEELRAVGRRHTAHQARQAIDTLRSAGFDNLSVDLIFGLPGQTVKSWQTSLNVALSVRPEHLSAYCLSYEPGTALWQQRERGEVVEATEPMVEEMYNLLRRASTDAGYEHYEISNFALPGRYSRHNSSYWDGTPYLGLGAGAHSYDGLWRRHINPADIAAFERDVLERGQVSGEDDVLGKEERYEEMVMLGLRTVAGIDLNRLERVLGADYRQRLLAGAAAHLADGLLLQAGDCLRLSATALLRSDMIIRDII